MANSLMTDRFGVEESEAWMVNRYMPDLEGMPDSTPSILSRSPGGSPPVDVNVYGALAP